MFLFLFNAFGLAKVKTQCEAPTLDISPASSEYELVFAHLLLRHGSRAPDHLFLPQNHRGAWFCNSKDGVAPVIEAVPLVHPRRLHRLRDSEYVEFQPNCGKGELTLDGQEEHHRLGKSYNTYLVNQTKLLPENLDPTTISLRTTHMDRTHRSLLSFFQGLYPPMSPNEQLDVQTGAETIDSYHPQKTTCPEFEQLFSNFTTSPEFVEKRTVLTEKIQPIMEWVGIDPSTTNPNTLNSLCDFLNTYYCYDQIIPPEVPQEAVDQCLNWLGYMMHGLYKTNKLVAASRTATQVLKIFEKKLSGVEKSRFSVVASHDSTLYSYLVLLGVQFPQDLDAIPYASHVLNEIYKKEQTYYVRVVANNKVMKLNGVDELIPYSEFVELLKPATSHCTNTEVVQKWAVK